MINLRDLNYFTSVVKLKHFGKAAEENFVSQPALSMQIKKLEYYLDVKLFERHKKQVITTEIGQQLAVIANNILNEFKVLKQTADCSRDPLAGNFKLASFPTLAPYLFPHLAPNIKQALPKLTLILIEEKTESIIEQLNNGQLDAAILANPEPILGCVIQPLFEEPFYVAVSKQHPWAAKQTITFGQLADEELLLLDEGHCMRDSVLTVCQLAQTKENQTIRATSLEMLRAMIKINIGVTLIPESAKLSNDDLHYIPFKVNPPTRQLCLVYRKNTAKKACIDAILKIASLKK